ncbi:uncharacterized protein V6R79_000268 [Siganus canaliculatus]
MKKKRDQSGEKPSGQQPADYVVGQVSGSLFQKNSAASGSSLSALFSTAAPAASLLFQPAPKPVEKSTEATKPQEETPEQKDLSSQKKKKLKVKSKADKKLENREINLQNADQDEQQQQTAPKKKKRKAPEPEAENDVEKWVMKRQKLRAQKAEEAIKRKRTVFVGNLPIGCTKKTLQNLFKDKGTIESIRFRSVVREDPSISRKVAVIQRKVHPKKQSMNAYVVFKDDAAVEKALESNGLEIEKDFHIRVDRATASSSHDHKRSVFVGNLSFETKEFAFRRHFEECGAVEAVRLVRDKDSGLGKGFGYVLFESTDSVQLALKLEGTQLEGRSIRVKRSVKKEKQKNKPDAQGFTGRNRKGPMKGPAKGPMKGPAKGPMKGPAKGPMKGPGQDRRGNRESFNSQKKHFGNQQNKNSAFFKGEMVDPSKKSKPKGLKKKRKPKKTVHI